MLPSLAVWDTTDTTTTYETDYVSFYANLTKRTNTSFNLTAPCYISFNVSGGWTAPRLMAYNSTSMAYKNRTNFSVPGLKNWNVSCARERYKRAAAQSAFQISSKYMADLSVSHEEIIPDNYFPAPETRVIVNVTVHNLGMVRAVQANVTLYINKTYLNSTLLNVSAGGFN
jgi:hypothetical protein